MDRTRLLSQRLRWWLSRQAEARTMQFVWLLPRGLVYWAVIRCWAYGTTGPYGTTEPDSLTWSEALRRWEGR